MNRQHLQPWRGELINSYERLKEVRTLLRMLSGLPLPDESDEIAHRPHEMHVIFRICQLVYGSHGHGFGFVHFLAIRMKWFVEDGELPDYVLRAHEMMLESGLREDLQRLYRASAELEFSSQIPDIDHDAYRERVGRLLASVALRRRSMYAL